MTPRAARLRTPRPARPRSTTASSLLIRDRVADRLLLFGAEVHAPLVEARARLRALHVLILVLDLPHRPPPQRLADHEVERARRRALHLDVDLLVEPMPRLVVVARRLRARHRQIAVGRRDRDARRARRRPQL